jgi:hypothetical protein
MNRNVFSKAEVFINATPSRVWKAMNHPEFIKHSLSDSESVRGWLIDGPIIGIGTWEDKTRWSALPGLPDSVGNKYKNVNYQLSAVEGGTRLTILQDDNGSPEKKQSFR